MAASCSCSFQRATESPYLSANSLPQNLNACSRALGCDSVMQAPENALLTRHANSAPPTKAAPRKEFAVCAVPGENPYSLRSTSSTFLPAPSRADHRIGASIPSPSSSPLASMLLTACSTEETVSQHKPPSSLRNASPNAPLPRGLRQPSNSSSHTFKPAQAHFAHLGIFNLEAKLSQVQIFFSESQS